MPHLVILCTGNLDAETDMAVLPVRWPTPCCSNGAGTAKPCSPSGARACWPIPRHISQWRIEAEGRARGGMGHYAFGYLKLCIGRGRSDARDNTLFEKPHV